ncbi:hypothetical protein [Aquimonas voraii]|uniref:Uncharacterized protein n=1 Tax=Aquimonas voraii TaxID=265719 RepID=A0A1G6WPX2_9GAMM|nr:hypothetical protein [Aquimonas voraii]SDD67085.1 hypothetical protein SAMN04488509_10577 [Aquimonas voraii]
MHGSDEIVTAGSATALWHDLVREGEQRCGAQLDENSESWLVFTLMRHLGSTGLAEPAMGLVYLEALRTAGSAQRSLALQEVGERCLLIAGLYPELAQRRRVSQRYYIELGQGAFRQLAEEARRAAAELYAGIAEQFARLVRVLVELRALSGEWRGLDPLERHALSLAARTPRDFESCILIGESGRA